MNKTSTSLSLESCARLCQTWIVAFFLLGNKPRFSNLCSPEPFFPNHKNSEKLLYARGNWKLKVGFL